MAPLNSREKRVKLRAAWEKVKGICWICERYVPLHEATLDHVMPKSHGGRYSTRNLRVACRRCNTERGTEPASTWAPRVLGISPQHAARIAGREAHSTKGQKGTHREIHDSSHDS